MRAPDDGQKKKKNKNKEKRRRKNKEKEASKGFFDQPRRLKKMIFLKKEMFKENVKQLRPQKTDFEHPRKRKRKRKRNRKRNRKKKKEKHGKR